MIRFANPASNLHIFITIFQEVYRRLKDRARFDVDDIKKAMIDANLMSSSGNKGDKALALGSNKDKTRDKPYNNAKMFSEWFRLLGWISSTEQAALVFQFTYLGAHMGEADATAAMALMEECLLGITNPNQVLDVKYGEHMKLFQCSLRLMHHLDGWICRDELIVGPMCGNDTTRESFRSIVERIAALRGNPWQLDDALVELCEDLGVAVNTAHNYTRLLISFLKGIGWASAVNNKGRFPNRPSTFLELTEKGRKTAEQLEQVCDLRLADWMAAGPEEQKALIRLGFYQMLGRAGYILDSVEEQVERDGRLCRSVTGGRPLYFSPYQVLGGPVANGALGYRPGGEEMVPEMEPAMFDLTDEWGETLSALSPLPLNLAGEWNGERLGGKEEAYIKQVREWIAQGLSPRAIAEEMGKHYQEATEPVFYPLVAMLFRILGFPCAVSRKGDNAERWDAIIVDSPDAVPIEIKSPTEEGSVSVKAVRQALENKIVLLSRESYPVRAETTSLAVGFHPPSGRADVRLLIDDIKKTYGFSIAALDFFSLVELTVRAIAQNQAVEKDRFYRMEGIVRGFDIIANGGA